MQTLQGNWLGQDGILLPFLKCATVSALAMLACIWLDILVIATWAEHGYDSGKGGVVGNRSSFFLQQLCFCSIGLGFAFIPALLVTATCETLCQNINDLRCKLNHRLASGMLQGRHDSASMHADIFLVDELQTSLQNLNHKQGMGCAMFGFRMSGPLVQAFLVTMASVAPFYLPKLLEFYHFNFAGHLWSDTA